MKFYSFFPLVFVFFVSPWIPLIPTEEGGLCTKLQDNVALSLKVTRKHFSRNCCMIDIYKTLQIDFTFSDGLVRYETVKEDWEQVSLEDLGKFKKGFVSDNLLVFVLYGLGGDFLICCLPEFGSAEKSPRTLYNSRGHVNSQATFVQFPDNETVQIVNKEKNMLFICNAACCEYELLVPYDIEDWKDYMGCCNG